MFPPYPYRVVTEKASALQVLPQLVADGNLMLVQPGMQCLDRRGMRWQAVIYQPLPVKLRGTLLRQPVPVVSLCSHALELQGAALAHLDYRRQQRSGGSPSGLPAPIQPPPAAQGAAGLPTPMSPAARLPVWVGQPAKAPARAAARRRRQSCESPRPSAASNPYPGNRGSHSRRWPRQGPARTTDQRQQGPPALPTHSPWVPFLPTSRRSSYATPGLYHRRSTVQ